MFATLCWTSLAAPLARHVSDTFEADPAATTATLGAYRASDAYGIAHQMFLVEADQEGRSSAKVRQLPVLVMETV